MGMADPRSHDKRNCDFIKNKQAIIDKIEELWAVNVLEYHNVNWLSGSPKSRCQDILETLNDIKTEIHNLKW